jgi:hypothetical protein
MRQRSQAWISTTLQAVPSQSPRSYSQKRIYFFLRMAFMLGIV